MFKTPLTQKPKCTNVYSALNILIVVCADAMAFRNTENVCAIMALIAMAGITYSPALFAALKNLRKKLKKENIMMKKIIIITAFALQLFTPYAEAMQQQLVQTQRQKRAQSVVQEEESTGQSLQDDVQPEETPTQEEHHTTEPTQQHEHDGCTCTQNNSAQETTQTEDTTTTEVTDTAMPAHTCDFSMHEPCDACRCSGKHRRCDIGGCWKPHIFKCSVCGIQKPTTVAQHLLYNPVTAAVKIAVVVAIAIPIVATIATLKALGSVLGL